VSRKFVVYAWNYKHRTTAYPIYLEFKRRGLDVEFIYLNSCPEHEIAGIAGESFAKADCIITSSNCAYPYHQGFASKMVWLWHGAGNVVTREGEQMIATWEATKNSRLCLLLGSIDETYFKKNMSNIAVVGYPKFDNIESVDLKLPHPKTILFTDDIIEPETIATAVEIAKKASKVAKKNNYNFVIRPYNVDCCYHSSDIGHILTEHDDLASYIQMADIVIGDKVGSPIYEAVGLNKQIVYYQTQPPRKQVWIVHDYPHIGLEATIDTIETVLQQTIDNPNLLKKEREELRDKLYYKLDGKASVRAVDAILRTFELEDPMSQTQFSKEDKIKLIESVPYWWHHVDVGDGVVTPGHQGHPQSTIDKLNRIDLPEDLTGKTVLDIGCADGFFSFECERRGAKRVVALDHKGHNCEKGFKVLHTIFQSKVEYVEADFLDIDPQSLGTFDIVLFLGILYHLRYPVKALDILRGLTKGSTIIETHYLPDSTEKVIHYHHPLNSSDHCTWQISQPCLEDLFTIAGFKYKFISAGGNRITHHLT